MDRSERALLGVEENSAAIKRQEKLLRAAESKTDELKPALYIAPYNTSLLGNLTADEKTIVLVVFEGAATTLSFCGTVVSYNTSPMITRLFSGTGELRLGAVRSNARAIVFQGK